MPVGKTAMFLTLLAAACGGALADTLTINNIPYIDVKVTGADNCRISYEVLGTIREKPIGQVGSMNLMGRTALNKADSTALRKEDRGRLPESESKSTIRAGSRR